MWLHLFSCNFVGKSDKKDNKVLHYIMNNKNKPNTIIKPSQSVVNSRRPKRCNLCKKSFPPDKYNQHFQNCYRFQNKRKEENRILQHRTAPKNQSAVVNHPSKADIQPQKNQFNPQRPESNNRFRIKNNSHHSNFPSRPTPARQSKKEQKPPIKRSTLPRQVQKKEQKKQERREQKKEEQKVEIGREEMEERTMFERTISVESSVDEQMTHFRGQQIARQPQIQPRVEENVRENSYQSSSIQPSRNQPPIASPPPPPPPPQSPQREEPRQASLPVFQEINPQNDAQYDIQSMISNSNSIIDFIRSNEIISRDEALSAMMSQLQQTNLMATQIADLNELARSFVGFRISNVFAMRIHELQTAIIHQIGVALVRSFNGELGFQFQNIAQNQPSIRPGFTEEQIDRIFEEKINLSQKQCSICLQDMKKSQLVLQLQCNHFFHPSCIREWLLSSKKCPMCRSLQQQQVS